MEYTIKSPYDRRHSQLQEEKIKFLKGVFERMSLSFELDEKVSYDVYARLYIKEFAQANDIIIIESAREVFVRIQNKEYRWEVVREDFLIQENRLSVLYKINLTSPE